MEAVTTRAKFKVDEISKTNNGKTTRVVLHPVTSGSEENKNFFEYTPSGKIELFCVNPNVNFEFGEYYLDFVKADQ